MKRFIATTIREYLNEQSKVLLAPNGEPSNLSNDLYEYVRTDEFKKWFGDWLNDPVNSSKIVDENGEPMVYYKSLCDDTVFFGDSNNYHYGITCAAPTYDVAKGFGIKKPKTKTKSIFIKSIKPFDFRIPEHKNWLIGEIANDKYAKLYTDFMINIGGNPGYEYTKEDLEYYIETGGYSILEWKIVYNKIKEKNFDSFYMMEDIDSGLQPNISLFESNQIKIID